MLLDREHLLARGEDRVELGRRRAAPSATIASARRGSVSDSASDSQTRGRTRARPIAWACASERRFAASSRTRAASHAPAMCSGAIHTGARASTVMRTSVPSQTAIADNPSATSVHPITGSRGTRNMPTGTAPSIHSGTSVPSQRVRCADSVRYRALRPAASHEDALPAAPELRPLAVHAAMEEAVGEKYPGQPFPRIDEPREVDILEQRRFDCCVSADVFVRRPREEHELTIREGAPVRGSVREGQRILAHELERRGGLHDALEPGVEAERAEQTQQIELALAHQRQRCGDATRRERGVGIREEQVVGTGCTAGARHARVQRMDLAHPIGRTDVDLDDLEALVVADFERGRATRCRRCTDRAPARPACPDTFRRAMTARVRQ